ncbi:MAG TPA: nitrite/sulfite reductase [Steroidobacteraceae bacterium]|nr:nitrite/sulfite reductase [Steroidobacteraceae bacterium]
MATWKERLTGQMPVDLAREIDVYEGQIDLKKHGKIEDKLFGEARLRRGTYGQRYDNGQRHDGITHRNLSFPTKATKGTETVWDAPGMQRIKIPFGGLNPKQMDVLADVAEEYSDAICHITTRQDVQLHYVHIEDTPDVMRRLASVGITTREACGNSVRNVTACSLAGVCRCEAFDTTPYAKAMAYHLLGHPDTQDMGRKFKVAFSGCKTSSCGLTNIHDLGFIAKTWQSNGATHRGFEVVVGGGLGAVPYDAKLFEATVPEEEIMPLAQATCRVFARLGEKRNRGRARLKFLIEKIGFDEFRRLVIEERKVLPHDPRWTEYLKDVARYEEKPAKAAERLDVASADPAFEAWRTTNVYAQRQPGYVVATVTLPLGDITSWQMRQLANVARRYVGDNVRSTVEQNLVLRWVSEADLPALFAELQRLDLALPGAGKIEDVVACPGTDTCKLGIAASRGLAAVLHESLVERQKQGAIDPAVRDLHIKMSGCFNSCGQHHLADIGFYGVSRKIGGATVPHFRVLMGGEWENNGATYGLTIGAVPSKRIPEFIDHVTQKYLAGRQPGERFKDYCARIGKKALKEMVDAFSAVPAYAVDRTLYSDWRDPREFTISDITTGECAGEVVPQVEFDLQAAEQRNFEAQIYLEQNEVRKADETAYQSMLVAARGLVRTQLWDLPDDADRTVAEFKTRFYDTQLFQSPDAGQYAGGKFALYLINRHADKERVFSVEKARHLIEEAQLFIEAAYGYYQRMTEQQAQAKAARFGAFAPAEAEATT